MYSYSKFAKHTLAIGILHALGFIQSLIFLPIITKILGAADYGIWSQVKATLVLLVPVSFLGLSAALERFISGEKDDKKIREGVYSSLIFITLSTLFVGLLFFIFSELAGNFFGFSGIFVKLLSVILIFEALNTALLVIIQSRRQIGKYFWFTILKTFGEMGLVSLVIFSGKGLFGAIFSLLIFRMFLFFLLAFYVTSKIRPLLPDFSLIKEYFSYGLPTMGNSISFWIISSADRYIIAAFLGITYVGFYAPAYSIGMLLVSFIIPVTSMLTVVLPKFFEEKNISEVQNYLSHSLKYFLLIIIPAAFGLSVLAKQMLIIFSTEQIAENGYLVVPWVASSMIVYGLACFFSQVLSLAKKTKLFAAIWALTALINLGLNIILIPKFGIIAGGITTLATYSFGCLVTWHYSLKEISFKIDWAFVLKAGIVSFLMALSVRWFDPKGLVQIIGSIFSAAIFYFIVMIAIGGFTKKEFKFLKNLVYEMVFFGK